MVSFDLKKCVVVVVFFFFFVGGGGECIHECHMVNGLNPCRSISCLSSVIVQVSLSKTLITGL